MLLLHNSWETFSIFPELLSASHDIAFVIWNVDIGVEVCFLTVRLDVSVQLLMTWVGMTTLTDSFKPHKFLQTRRIPIGVTLRQPITMHSLNLTPLQSLLKSFKVVHFKSFYIFTGLSVLILLKITLSLGS